MNSQNGQIDSNPLDEWKEQAELLAKSQSNSAIHSNPSQFEERMQQESTYGEEETLKTSEFIEACSMWFEMQDAIEKSNDGLSVNKALLKQDTVDKDTSANMQKNVFKRNDDNDNLAELHKRTDNSKLHSPLSINAKLDLILSRLDKLETKLYKSTEQNDNHHDETGLVAQHLKPNIKTRLSSTVNTIVHKLMSYQSLFSSFASFIGSNLSGLVTKTPSKSHSCTIQDLIIPALCTNLKNSGFKFIEIFPTRSSRPLNVVWIDTIQATDLFFQNLNPFLKKISVVGLDVETANRDIKKDVPSTIQISFGDGLTVVFQVRITVLIGLISFSVV